MMLARLLLRQYWYVYQIDRWVRQHFTPTGHVFIALLIGSGVYGIDTKASNTYQLFMVLLVLLIGSLILSCFNRYQFSLTRQLPLYVTCGEPLEYTVRLTITTPLRPVDNLSYADQLSDSPLDYQQLCDYFSCSTHPWYQRLISYRQWRQFITWQHGGIIKEIAISEQDLRCLEFKVKLMPLRRGRLSFSRGYLAKPDLLGLFKRLFYQEHQQSLWVLPRRYDDIPNLLLPGRRQYQADGINLASSVGDSAEFISLREYKTGDSLNHIHWKSYAKQGKLIVKDSQDEYFVRKALLLDTFLGETKRECFEVAVSIAATLSISERQNDSLLDLMFVAGQTYRFTSGRGIDHLPHIQEILASVQGQNSDNITALEHSVINYCRECSSFICILLHWDFARQQLVKQIQMQGLPVAVFLVHDGNQDIETLNHRPEIFYCCDYRLPGQFVLMEN